jgi:Ca2+-binding EF-hand superfamily protein
LTFEWLQAAFKNQDKDNSGTFNSFELRETLREIGTPVVFVQQIRVCVQLGTGDN